MPWSGTRPPRSVITALYIFLTVLTFLAVLVFVFLIYYYDGLSGAKHTKLEHDRSIPHPEDDLAEALLLRNSPADSLQGLDSSCENVNSQHVTIDTSLDLGNMVLVWTSIDETAYGLFVISRGLLPNQASTCTFAPYGPHRPVAAVAAKNTNLQNQNQHQHPSTTQLPTYLLFYVPKLELDSREPGGEVPLVVARAPFRPDLLAIGKWSFWEEKTGGFSGTYYSATPIFSLDPLSALGMSVTWNSYLSTYIAAYGDENKIALRTAHDLWGTNFSPVALTVPTPEDDATVITRVTFENRAIFESESEKENEKEKEKEDEKEKEKEDEKEKENQNEKTLYINYSTDKDPAWHPMAVDIKPL